MAEEESENRDTETMISKQLIVQMSLRQEEDCTETVLCQLKQNAP